MDEFEKWLESFPKSKHVMLKVGKGIPKVTKEERDKYVPIAEKFIYDILVRYKQHKSKILTDFVEKLKSKAAIRKAEEAGKIIDVEGELCGIDAEKSIIKAISYASKMGNCIDCGKPSEPECFLCNECFEKKKTALKAYEDDLND